MGETPLGNRLSYWLGRGRAFGWSWATFPNRSHSYRFDNIVLRHDNIILPHDKKILYCFILCFRPSRTDLFLFSFSFIFRGLERGVTGNYGSKDCVLMKMIL